MDIERERGVVHVSPAARRFLETRFAASTQPDARLMQALLHAAAGMARSGKRTQTFAHGIALSHELHPSDQSRMTLLLHDAQATDAHPAEALLTARQREVARSAAAGATTRAIADELSLSADTVKEHLEAIYRRLGVGSRGELMVLLSR